MKGFTKTLTAIIILIATLSSDVASAQPAGFASLFNGHDLSGWHVSRTSHQGTTPNFFVKDSAIIVNQKPYGQGGVLLTNKKYHSFELHIEVKIDSFCNGGIFLRSTESGQAYQIELALPGGNGSLYGEAMSVSRSVKAEGVERVWRPGDWNSLRIRMQGDIPTVALWINDVFMWEVTQPKNDFTAGATSGMIGLQSHWSATYQGLPGGFNMPGAWRPGAAHRFRNAYIKELD
ncbi:MAG: DUF1080 domain-containing protein [Chryseolinea sp.]